METQTYGENTFGPRASEINVCLMLIVSDNIRPIYVYHACNVRYHPEVS